LGGRAILHKSERRVDDKRVIDDESVGGDKNQIKEGLFASSALFERATMLYI
jgi:hypothetical protein